MRAHMYVVHTDYENTTRETHFARFSSITSAMPKTTGKIEPPEHFSEGTIRPIKIKGTMPYVFPFRYPTPAGGTTVKIFG